MFRDSHVGQVTQTVTGSTTTNYTYDNADQLNSTAVVGGTTTSYTYNAAGERTISGSTVLTWDQRGSLLTYGSSNSYAYSGSGLRTGKTVSGQVEAFVWDSAEGLAVLLQDGSTYYVTGSGGFPLEQISGSNVYYYQQDQLGSTRALTDSSGAVVASYSYDGYGNITTQSGVTSNPFLFSGQYRDAESGLYHMRARYYEPTTGQFISRDPKLSATWSPYGYAANNPLNMTDPSGLDFDPLGWLGNIAGAAGDAIGNAVNTAVGSITATWNNFTTQVTSFTNQAGTFLNGVASGFNVSDVASGFSAFFQDPKGWYWDHASDIAAWAGLIAMATWFIPGLDFLTVPIALICFAASAGASWHDIATGDIYTHPEHFLLDATGMVAGAGFLVEAARAAKIASGARDLADAGNIRGESRPGTAVSR